MYAKVQRGPQRKLNKDKYSVKFLKKIRPSKKSRIFQQAEKINLILDTQDILMNKEIMIKL